ncbi:unnamed protein product [Orchesella dallaii]|uniref:Uncharacterized protein n=1 Tax=Orchesella dallaii TaxID=48710 RepID=A0ABP1RUU6_9HEXA
MKNVFFSLPLSFFFFFLTTFYSQFPLSTCEVRQYTFNISYFSGSPDGVKKDKILGINNQYPGPTLEANQGDILEITVINNIIDGQNTSIHWHGISQRNGSLFEDGTSQISQCPLPAGGNSQVYRFVVEEAGTFWYHSHHFSQYTEGLFGALIVHANKEVYTYDDELTITLSDWYHQTAHENEKWHISCTSRGVPPYPNSGLMNGMGRFRCNATTLNNEGRTYECDTKKQMRPVFHLDYDKTYRIRLVNAAAVAAFNFSIDGHPLQTIEVDGVDVKESPDVIADIVPIAAGQRYSFLFKCGGGVSENSAIINEDGIGEEIKKETYLIRAIVRKESLMLLPGKNINEHTLALMINVTGVIECHKDKESGRKMETSENFSCDQNVPELPEEASTVQWDNDLGRGPLVVPNHFFFFFPAPKSDDKKRVVLDDMNLHPWDGSQAPPTFDKEFVVEVHFEEDRWNVRRGSFNNSPFVLPQHKPLLMTLLDNEPIPDSVFPLEIDDGDVVQVVINNPFYGPHPFHLHGHHFWVVGSGMWGQGNYTDSDGALKWNLTTNGVKRDTVLVQEKSWVVIRFKADNPGVWLFHCHIDWHNLSGMSLVFIEAKEKVRENWKVSEEVKRVCDLHKYINATLEDEPSEDVIRF